MSLRRRLARLIDPTIEEPEPRLALDVFPWRDHQIAAELHELNRTLGSIERFRRRPRFITCHQPAMHSPDELVKLGGEK